MGGIPLTALLLDTHTLVWLMEGNSRLGKRARQRIQAAARTDELLVSAISAWEIAMLVQKNRLVLDRDVAQWLHAAMAMPGISLAPLSLEVAVESTRLPGSLHPDPADRIIAATARHHVATLVTDDQRLLEYGAAGHLKVQPAAL